MSARFSKIFILLGFLTLSSWSSALAQTSKERFIEKLSKASTQSEILALMTNYFGPLPSDPDKSNRKLNRFIGISDRQEFEKIPTETLLILFEKGSFQALESFQKNFEKKIDPYQLLAKDARIIKAYAAAVLGKAAKKIAEPIGVKSQMTNRAASHKPFFLLLNSFITGIFFASEIPLSFKTVGVAGTATVTVASLFTLTMKDLIKSKLVHNQAGNALLRISGMLGTFRLYDLPDAVVKYVGKHSAQIQQAANESRTETELRRIRNLQEFFLEGATVLCNKKPQ